MYPIYFLGITLNEVPTTLFPDTGPPTDELAATVLAVVVPVR